MTLSARFVKAARKSYRCCECHRLIATGKPYLRLYGMADTEKPWHLRYCLGCAIAEVGPQERHNPKGDSKIVAACQIAEDWNKAQVSK